MLKGKKSFAGMKEIGSSDLNKSMNLNIVFLRPIVDYDGKFGDFYEPPTRYQMELEP